FNTDNRTEPCINTFSQVVVTSNVHSPWPTDHNGNGNTNASRSKPYDWVLADPDLYVLETPLRVGASIFPNGIVFDSRVYTPLADVAPVQSGDSSASNMQHMAVAKDFLISP
ncbi:MAG: endonuclease, partial [Myxococcaceae bacterium]